MNRKSTMDQTPSSSATTPTYQNLFGSDSYYTVPPHRSVLSPAAYLVELIKLVENNITVKTGGIPLQERRPDLWKIKLDERNTDHEIPKLDIVNEVLKNDLGSDSDSSNLSIAKYPFTLPYNQHLEETRTYLKQNNTSLPKIWKSLLPESSKSSEQKKSIHLETLGLSPEQWNQYTTSVQSKDLYKYYGFSASTSGSTIKDKFKQSIAIFLKQTGLTQKELQELIYEDLSDNEISENKQGEFYINLKNSDKPISIKGEKLEGLTTTNLGRIMRFVRMAKAIGWSFTDLDWALQTISPLVDKRDDALPYLAWIHQQIKERGLTVNQCCGVLGRIKDFGEKDGPTFFDSIFKTPGNPQLPSPQDGNKHIHLKIPILGLRKQNDASKKTQSALTSALKISSDELFLISRVVSEFEKQDDTTIVLDNTHLALLYRLSLLPQLCGATINETLVSSKLISPNQSLIAKLHNGQKVEGEWLTVSHPNDALVFWVSNKITSCTKTRNKPISSATTYKVKIDDTDNNQLEIALDTKSGSFISISLNGKIFNPEINSKNAAQCITIPSSIKQGLVSLHNENDGGFTNFSLPEIQDFFKWLASSPFSLAELQFILTGNSYNSSIENNKIGTDAVTNFVNTLNASLEKSLLDKIALSKAIETKCKQLISTLVQSDEFSEQLTILKPAPSKDQIEEFTKRIIKNLPLNSAEVSNSLYDELTEGKVDDNGIVVNQEIRKYDIINVLSGSISSVFYKNWKINPQIFNFPEIVENCLFPSKESNSNLEKIAKDLVDSLQTTLKHYYHIQQKTFTDHLSGLYDISTQMGTILKGWADLNIKEFVKSGLGDIEIHHDNSNLLSTILNVSSDDDEDGSSADIDKIMPMLQKLQQGAMMVTLLRLSPAEAKYFKTDYSVTSSYPIKLSSVKTIWEFKQLVKSFKDSQNKLLNILKSKKDKGKIIKSFASLTGWKDSQLIELTDEKHLDLKDDTIASAERLYQYFSTAQLLGINAEEVWNIVQLADADSDQFDKEKNIANALWAGLQVQLNGNSTTLTKIQNKLNEQLRNKLVALAIFQLKDQLANYSDNARGLYAYLLIDVEVSGVPQTTKIREAISAVQLYVNRCLNQLEAHTSINDDSNLPSLWKWMQSYREWQANREVFLYPEDYIQPELRVDKTDLFSKAEHKLKQTDLTNPDSVEAVFKDYMIGFEEIGQLQVVSSAARYDNSGKDKSEEIFQEICMIGKPNSATGHYYFRLSKFRKPKDKEEYVPYDWGPWEKITVPIHPLEYQPGKFGTPSTIFAFGRWYVFWVEQKQTDGSTNAQGDKTKKYTIYLHCTYLDFNGNWASSETIASTLIGIEPRKTAVKCNIELQFDSDYLKIIVGKLIYMYNPSYSPGEIQSSIQCFEEFSNVVYAGTQHGLLYKDSNIWKRKETIFSNANITCLKKINNDQLYVGTTNGLFSYDGDIVTPQKGNSGLLEDNFKGLITNHEETELIAYTSDVLYKLEETGDIWLTVSTKGIDGEILCAAIVYLRNKQISYWYIGTSKGLFYLKDDLWYQVEPLTIEATNYIEPLHFANGDSPIPYVYAGASNGLFFQQDTATSFQQSTGLSLTFPEFDQAIQCLATYQAQDSEGNYYITGYLGTSQGLYYCDSSTINPTWKLIDGVTRDVNIITLKCTYNKVYVGTPNGVYENSVDLLQFQPAFPTFDKTLLRKDSLIASAYPSYYESAISVFNQKDWFIINDGRAQYLNIPVSAFELNVYRLNSTALGKLGEKLNEPNGVEKLITITTQQTSETSPPTPAGIAVGIFPTTTINFTQNDAMRMYFWELFFHLPFLIAKELNVNQHFEHTKTWLQYIFNPGITKNLWDLKEGNQDEDKNEYENDKYWRFQGLRCGSVDKPINKKLQEEHNETELQELRKDLDNPLELYVSSSEPFDPQAIAQIRPIAYQKTIVTHYISNLLAWGDLLYRENTRNSINEAEMLYVEAYNLLGEKPKDLGEEILQPSSIFSSIGDINITCINNDLIGTTVGLLQYDNKSFYWIPELKGKEITCLFNYSDDDFLAGTNGNGLFESNDGITWAPVKSNEPNLSSSNVTCLYQDADHHFAGTTEGMYFGAKKEWNLADKIFNVTCIGGITTVYFGTSSDRYFRYDWGVKPYWFPESTMKDITTFFINSEFNHPFIIGTADGPFDKKKEVGSLLSGQYITCFYFDNSWDKKEDYKLYAGTKKNGLHCMKNAKNHEWDPVKEIPTTCEITAIVGFSNGIMFAGTNDGLYTYNPDDNNNTNWLLLPDNYPQFQNTRIDLLYKDSFGTLFIATASKGLWKVNHSDGYNFKQITLPPNFGIPRNQQFLNYWGEVQSRIYNIRHGLTIDGQTDELPLFSPPINPMQMVEAVGSGEGIEEAVPSANLIVPYYRFEVMITKAKEVNSFVIQLGQSVLSALQTKDAQKLAELYNTHQQNILELTKASRQDQLKSSQENTKALQSGLVSAANRQTHYANLLGVGLSAGEITELILAGESIVIQAEADAIMMASIIGYMVPNIYGFSDGGMQFGNAINQGAQILQNAGNLLNQGSQIAGTVSGYQRRAQDWQLQEQLAADDIKQINHQIVASQYQADLAQQGINLLAKSTEQQDKVADFYLNKFTNDQLYSWYIGELSGLYFQVYQLAHDIAMQAENAWKFEHIGRKNGKASTNFIKPGYWNSLHQGLLTGEALQLDLHRMEKAFLDQDERRLEITKTVSLALLDPKALMDLKSGSCQFDIIEKDFAFDYPGHFCRKIKSISISIPMILGPYQNIHATLTQLTNKLVSEDGDNGEAAVKYLLDPQKNPLTPEAALQMDLVPNQQIALSQGIGDTGMFQLNFNDPRYLPFEGTGAVSSWLLEMPKEDNSINFESIADVIMEIKYTALPANSEYTNVVRTARKTGGGFNGFQMISLAQEFPSAWHGFTKEGKKLTFSIDASKWRGAAEKDEIYITQMYLYVDPKAPSELKFDISDLGASSKRVTFNIEDGESHALGKLKKKPNKDKPFSDVKHLEFPTSKSETDKIVLECTKGKTFLTDLTNLILVVKYSCEKPKS